MGKTEEIFKSYGVDYTATMSRFMGNRELYLRFLNRFPEDNNVELLGKALEQGDREGAFAAAHTLKGVAGNLGLTALHDAASAIVEPLRRMEEREDYSEMYQKVKVEFERVDELLQEIEKGEAV